MEEQKSQTEIPDPLDGEDVVEPVIENDGKSTKKYHNEKHNDDTVGSVAWAFILIWAGFVFLADNMGWLANITLPLTALPEGWEITGLGTWTLILLGAGVITLLAGIIKMILPRQRHVIGGTFFLAALLLGFGFANIYGWSNVWPIVLIAMGLTALAGALVRTKK
ncbi:MAG: hypothetical protein MUO40_05470 [Anaerolineaceae bacterium]|nr:hypothetical protein [Anaerolineaceae bacterium]